MKNQDKLNCMAQVIAPPVSKGYYGGTCTLAISVGSDQIQLGALKVIIIFISSKGSYRRCFSIINIYGSYLEQWFTKYLASLPTKCDQSEIYNL